MKSQSFRTASVLGILVAALGFGAVGCSLSAPTTTTKHYFAYVVNGGAHTVSAYSINSSTGALTQVSGSPFATGTGPQGIAADPAGKFLYVANYGAGAGNTVSAYTINASSGALMQVTGSPFTIGPASSAPIALAVDPSGKFLYVANNAANEVAGFIINGTSGTLGAISTSPFTGLSNPIAVAVAPSGGYLYVANSLGSSLAAYTINSATGVISSTLFSPVAVGTGTNPTAIAITGTGSSLFVADGGTGNIYGFSVNTASGDLTASTSPFTTAHPPVSLATNPSGTDLYAADGTTIDGFSITGPGALAALSTVTAGTGPYALAFDPQGKFLYVVNKTSNNISGFSINSSTGALLALSDSPFAAGTGPNSIATVTTTTTP